MIKLEIRASTIIFAKNNAKQKRNEEKVLLMRLNQLQEKLRSNFSEARKVEMEGVKNELPKIVCKKKTRGAMSRSKVPAMVRVRGKEQQIFLQPGKSKSQEESYNLVNKRRR